MRWLVELLDNADHHFAKEVFEQDGGERREGATACACSLQTLPRIQRLAPSTPNSEPETLNPKSETLLHVCPAQTLTEEGMKILLGRDDVNCKEILLYKAMMAWCKVSVAFRAMRQPCAKSVSMVHRRLATERSQSA